MHMWTRLLSPPQKSVEAFNAFVPAAARGFPACPTADLCHAGAARLPSLISSRSSDFWHLLWALWHRGMCHLYQQGTDEESEQYYYC